MAITRILPVVVFFALLFLALFVVACDDTEEATPASSGTPAATTPVGPTGSSASPTVTERPTAPADWPEYTAPGESPVSLRYPPDWYLLDGGIYSIDPATVPGPGAGTQPQRVQIEIARYQAAGGGCVSVEVNLENEIYSVDPLATDTFLGGQPAWERFRDEDLDPPITGGRTIATIYKGYCIVLAARYINGALDDGTFAKIADSFELEF